MSYYEHLKGKLNEKVTMSNSLIKDIQWIVNSLVKDELSLMDISRLEDDLELACDELKDVMKEIVRYRLYIAFEEAGDSIEMP